MNVSEDEIQELHKHMLPVPFCTVELTLICTRATNTLCRLARNKSIFVVIQIRDM